MLEKLLRLRIEGFESTADTVAMGLSEPMAEVQLFGGGEDQPETIRVGKPSPKGGSYARLEPRGVTVRLPASIQEVLAFDIASLRDTSLARINLDLVDMIRLTSESSRFELKRKGDGWVIGDKPVRPEAVQEMVEALTGAKATGFEPATMGGLEKAGLSKPALVVEFFAVVSENTPETTAGNQLVIGLKFGSKEDADLIPVLTTGSPEIAMVPGKILKSIPAEESSWLAP